MQWAAGQKDTRDIDCRACIKGVFVNRETVEGRVIIPNSLLRIKLTLVSFFDLLFSVEKLKDGQRKGHAPLNTILLFRRLKLAF